MQQKTINMLDVTGKMESLPDARLSFKPFINFLEQHLQDKNSVKRDLFEFVLKKFQSFDQIEADVDLEQIPKYKELLDLLYVVLTNVTEDEKDIYWGLCVPMSPVIFYGSSNFYKLLDDANEHDMECAMENEEFEEFQKTKLEHFYVSVLEKFYHVRIPKRRALIRTIKDKQTGLTRHFSINLNTSFVDLESKSPLPVMDMGKIHSHASTDDVLANLYELLPISMFSLRGFTILTITDVTQQYALETIKNNIVKNQGYSGSYSFPEIVQALKELTGSSTIEFNILPLFRVNGKLAEDTDTYNRSILFSSGQKGRLTDKVCLSMMEQFVSTPQLFLYDELDPARPSQPEAARILKEAGISSYTLVPVFYNKKLVGAVEAYSRQKGSINEQTFTLLESAKELLAQLMYNSLCSLEAEIESVIKEHYTRLQPSVQWKFVETAWRHLQSAKGNTGALTREQEQIGFKNVYPLYGAVDIRNSTIERNTAMSKDNLVQFEVLLKVLTQLKQQSGFGLLDEKIYTATKWFDILKTEGPGFSQQVKLNDFLENNIIPFLRKFTDQRPELQTIAGPYFQAIDEEKGIAFENRRQLEISMSKVISSVNSYFDRLKDEIQQAYPCYFEKFRTDGVEYDIYIGQSISPDLPYSDIYLKNLRLMQLTSMAAIARYTHALVPHLPNPVETTQLIFIHSQPIDILFRNDEKRFDVEGAYNIRYHIIKKRIDKVHLKDSAERLTQPNKIALVYFSEKEADEYISYIKYLQADNILEEDLERLELEELAGVSGLKALRVGVNLADSKAEEMSAVTKNKATVN